jgi:NADPH-dependent 2,4-dienoyl-CoA reductase/sulfur reductase-like enzyme/rhodanese-related sulfurtransferase
MKGKKIVIIGGTACGPKSAARARRCSHDAEITIIEQGVNLSSATCGLPYYISNVIHDQESLLMKGASFFKDVLDINVMIRTKAIKIDRNAQQIDIIDLKTNAESSIKYDRLVIATGCNPIIPEIEGIKLSGIFTLSTIEDADAIKKYLSRGIKHATIVGAGLISMEMAEALSSIGIKVTIIDILNWILPTMLDFEMANYVARYAKNNGVNLRTGEKLIKFEGDKNGSVNKVVTANDSWESNIVIIAVGRKPNIAMAREAGLTIGTKGGILVNRNLQTNDPFIYAGGDCVENLHRVTGNNVLAPLGSTANKHGRVIGTNITDGKEEFPGIMGTAVAKLFGCNVARTGLSEYEARQHGFDVITCLIPGQDHAKYYPGFKEIIIKLIAKKNSGKLLGGQVIGPGEVAKRIDVLATALSFGATVDDMSNIDLAYAPPYNSAMDPLHNAANVIRNKRSGLAESLTPIEVEDKIKSGQKFILLDVRSESEWQNNRINAPQAKLMPLDKLRQNMDTLPKEMEIVTLCQSSIRAYQAQRILKGAGFSNVKFMDGSISIWPYESTGQPDKRK